MHRETVFLDDSPKVAWYSYLTGCGAAYFIQWVDDSGKPVDVFVADSRDSNAYIRYSSLSDAQENWFHSEVAEIGAPVTVMLDDCTMASVVKNLTSTGVRKIAIYHNDHTTEAHRAMNDAMSSWDVVICSTPGQAKALRKIVPQELRVTSISQPIPDAVQDLSGSSREADKFAFFGRLTSVKNVIPLVRSFTEVLKCLPGASLDIYGEGPLEVELRKVISDLQLRGNVRLMGHTDEATVRMRDYAAIILPSSFEAFGLVIGEAMLNETPVISFDSDYGPREIITHGVDGVLVPPSDFSALAKSVVQLGMDPEFARRMGKEGRRTVLRRFNSDVIMAEWEKLVDDLYRSGGHL
ncbi:glycosyltransferase [Arthrobacter sp. IK3]|uniref:glycosyltransferase n=1 Tax=Arthrobacter sp. IK3 TaxID=3448169 RepID=UPI003EE29861